MSEAVIKVSKIGKRYQIGERQHYYTLRDTITNLFRKPLQRPLAMRGSEYIWALKNVSFDVKQGEVVGIIGRNGAGKSTLLKILARITEPTEGEAQIRGRVGSLLEIGTGFHSELTGRENIYLNGIILGLKRAEINKKFDEIVAFAGIDRFLDTPVKHYSSGMRVRLAFSVAAHLETEILFVDEVLAVGDIAFQNKCLGKLGGVVKEGRTVLFVSHNLLAIRDLCERAIWIEDGKIFQSGISSQVVGEYVNSFHLNASNGTITDKMHINASGMVYFNKVRLLNEERQDVTHISFREPLHLIMDMDILKPVKNMLLILAIQRFDGTTVSVFHHTDDHSKGLIDASPGRYEVCLKAELPLMPGNYIIALGAKPAPGYWGHGASWDWVPYAFEFSVGGASKEGFIPFSTNSLIHPPSTWGFHLKNAE